MRVVAERDPTARAPRPKQGPVWLLTLVALGFAAVGVCVPIFNARVVDTIQRSSRSEPTMTLVQFKAQVARLRASAALAGADPSPVRRRELRLALAIVRSRIGEFKQGQLGEFLASDPQRREKVAVLDQAVSQFGEAAGLSDLGEAARAVDRIAASIEAPLTDLGAAVVSQSNGLMVQDQADMRASQRMQMMMLIGVVASGFGLILFVTRQNAGLKRAHAEQMRLTEKFARIAMYDPLTGLLNRNGFAPEVEAAAARARGRRQRFALLTLDLDKFKVINDVFGHAAGDAILKSVSQRLQTVRNDVGDLHFARLGGDEFAVLVEGGQAAAEFVSSQIVELIRRPHDVGRLSITADTSIGVALAPDHGEEASDLMLASDIALYRAKAAGRGVTRLFKQSESNQRLGRANLETQLIEAVAAREFVPFYQPQVDLRTGRVVAAEALIRWRHDGAVIAPSEFLPFAEATGLIVEIERALLDALCRDLPSLPPDLKISFNLSAAQMFCTDVVDGLLGPLARARIDVRRLEVEITETMLLTNVDRVSQVMSALQSAGLSIALDDFGSGYSSLGYLRKFPFDKLKIDRMFVEGLAERSQAFTILKTVVALGRALDQSVVAEGVESAEQARLVQLAGCHLIQGYLVSRPVALPELLGLVAARNADALAARSA